MQRRLGLLRVLVLVLRLGLDLDLDLHDSRRCGCRCRGRDCLGQILGHHGLRHCTAAANTDVGKCVAHGSHDAAVVDALAERLGAKCGVRRGGGHQALGIRLDRSWDETGRDARVEGQCVNRRGFH